jgi:hypothetical protein
MGGGILAGNIIEHPNALSAKVSVGANERGVLVKLLLVETDLALPPADQNSRRAFTELIEATSDWLLANHPGQVHITNRLSDA